MGPSKAGRYELLQEVGRGAMGVVYKGHDPVIGRTVAVKLMQLSEAGTGLSREELVARFQAEARAAGRLTHPNIVVVYDAGEDQGQFYITMEFVEGSSLQSLLDRKQVFPLPRIMRIMEQACAALEYAHQNNVVHRDIKPANLMICSGDLVKIADFGLAKILSLGTTQTGQVAGTPSYMSPEQVKGKLVDGRSDIFSLGVILYELLTGEKPFAGQNITTVIYRIVNQEPIQPRELDASIHPGLSQAVTRALAKEPEARFQTCREFFEALRNYRELGAGLEATVVLPQRSTQASSRERPAEPATVRPRQPLAAAAARPAAEPARRNTAFWVTLILVIATLSGAGYFFWPRIQKLMGGDAAAVREASLPPEKGRPAETAIGSRVSPPGTSGEATLRSEETKGAPPPVVKEPVSPTPSGLVTPKMGAEKNLEQAGLAGRVQVEMAGQRLVLTGRLTAEERQRMRNALRALRYTDRTQVFRAETAEEERPRTAPGKGELEVLTDASGARARLKSPQGQVLECRTPCRFEDLAPGSYELEVTRAGFRTERRTVQIRADRITPLQLNFEPLSSGVYVTSRPGKADVYINGRKHAEQTPTKVPLAPGSYTITLQKTGYQDAQRSVQIQEDAVQQLDVQLAERRRGVGWLDVRTVPLGADVLVDGTNTGRKTPFKLELNPGQYTVTLYLKGYAVVRRTIVVEENQTVALKETLTRP